MERFEKKPTTYMWKQVSGSENVVLDSFKRMNYSQVQVGSQASRHTYLIDANNVIWHSIPEKFKKAS